MISVPFMDATGVRSFQDFPLSIKDWNGTRVRARVFTPHGAQTGSWLATLHGNDTQVSARLFNTGGCASRVEDSSKADKDQPVPAVYGFQKTQFRPGDALIIQGEHFNLTPGGGYVSLVGAFRDVAGQLIYREYQTSYDGWTSTQISVPLRLPAGAEPGTWVATVHRADGENASQAFTLLAPVAAPVVTPAPTPSVPSVTGDCQDAGDPVVEGFNTTSFCLRSSGEFMVIHGSHFCNTANGGFVTITAIVQDAQGNQSTQEYPASVTGWYSTQIQVQFVAPAGAVPGRYSATVHVTRKKVLKTASASFDVVACSN